MINQSKLAVRTAIEKLMQFVGYPFTFMFGLIFLVVLTDRAVPLQQRMYNSIAVLILLCISVFFIFQSRKMKNQVAHIKKYAFFFSQKAVISVEALAYALGEDVDFVKQDVGKLIAKNLLQGTHLDRTTNTVTFQRTPTVRARTFVDTESMSWGKVIGFIILFFPVGLYFLYKKFSADKNSRAMAGMGYTFTVIGGILMMNVIATDYPILVAFTILCIGIWLLRAAKKMKVATERGEKYRHLIYQQPVSSIDNLAAVVGVRYKTTLEDLIDMITEGHLTNVTMDIGTREIVQTNVSRQPVPTAASVHTASKAVTCSNCGANNVVAVGTETNCVYCGSPL